MLGQTAYRCLEELIYKDLQREMTPRAFWCLGQQLLELALGESLELSSH